MLVLGVVLLRPTQQFFLSRIHLSGEKNQVHVLVGLFMWTPCPSSSFLSIPSSDVEVGLNKVLCIVPVWLEQTWTLHVYFWMLRFSFLWFDSQKQTI